MGTLEEANNLIEEQIGEQNEEGKYSCKICQKNRSKLRIRDHIEKHLSNDILCTFCESKFGSVILLKQHKKNVHNSFAQFYKDNTNNKYFSSKQAPKGFIREVNGCESRNMFP